MRPVRKGKPIHYADGQPYNKAVGDLAARLGTYCSYCERYISTGLEVEHIQPKSIAANKYLEFSWSNFLLSCKNCNATKLDKNPSLNDWLIPDRDNTAAAFLYLKDGVIGVAPKLAPLQKDAANRTLSMMGLNKEVHQIVDELGNLVALDRRNQRLQAWLLAERYMHKWIRNPSADMAEIIEDIAKSSGFFSIWLTAFEFIPPIRQKLIDAFKGTESACFDPITTLPSLPHPNNDGLPAGAKL